MLKEGLTHTSRLVVNDQNTALAMGSGNLAVLATPAMLALMENAAMLAVANDLPDGCTTVGGRIECSHLKPTKVGGQVVAMALLNKVDGRKLYFHVEARQDDTLIGEGEHLRFIVDGERFMGKL